MKIFKIATNPEEWTSPELTQMINDITNGNYDNYIDIPEEPKKINMSDYEFNEAILKWKNIVRFEREKAKLKMLRNIKREFVNKSNRDFLNNLQTIHWQELSGLEEIIKHPNVELSTIGYRSPPYYATWKYVPFGLMIKGYVTLAGNRDMESRSYVPSEHKDWESLFRRNKRKYVDKLFLLKNMIMDEKDFIEYGVDNEQHNQGYNEIIVANWKPVAIVYDKKHDKKNEYQNGVKLATISGINLIDINGNILHN